MRGEKGRIFIEADRGNWKSHSSKWSSSREWCPPRTRSPSTTPRRRKRPWSWRGRATWTAGRACPRKRSGRTCSARRSAATGLTMIENRTGEKWKKEKKIDPVCEEKLENFLVQKQSSTKKPDNKNQSLTLKYFPMFPPLFASITYGYFSPRSLKMGT